MGGFIFRQKTKRSCLVLEDFDWEDDRLLNTFREIVIHRLHHGFTKHASSHTSDRGTFKAITVPLRAGHYDS